jgi:hypothetical protein
MTTKPDDNNFSVAEHTAKAPALSLRMPSQIENILRAGLDSGTVNDNGLAAIRQAMEIIATSGPAELRWLAADLLTALPEHGNVLLTIDDTRRMNIDGALAMSPQVHLYLFTAEGRTGLHYETFMHESMHVVLANRFSTLRDQISRANFGESESLTAVSALARFARVWDEFRTVSESEIELDSRTLNSIRQAKQSPDEFFVRALTDPMLQGYLSQVSYGNKTVWSKFTDWVKGALFRRDNTAMTPTWLPAALSASKELLREVIETRPKTLTPPLPSTTPEDAVMHSTSASQEQTPEFKNWFGDSVVVSDAGRPLVVYKGMPHLDWRTDKPISEIQSTNGPWAGFFTDAPSVAARFAQAFGRTNTFVVPVYLSIEKPYVIDAAGAKARDFQFDNLDPAKRNKDILSAISSGKYDGVIIRNTDDEGTIFVALKPEQVKSAIANNGDFDPHNPNMLFSTFGPEQNCAESESDTTFPEPRKKRRP